MSNIFFTADTHFGHTNIIKYSKRPFKNVNEMDEKLIENWNSVCNNDSIVYHLGDVFMGNDSYFNRICDKLDFRHLYIIKGNHDKGVANWYSTFKPSGVTLFNSYLETRIDGQDFTLCHYAMRVWNKSHHGAYHLYGYSHGSLPDDPNSLSFDCGVDCHDYKPISLEKVKEIMKTKNFKPIDHHTNT